MADEVHLWRIGTGELLTEIERAALDLESRLEEWLARDIAILDPDLLIMGRQVETDFGGLIDLLCIDAAGDLVIVELKRDKTPREITAQALDYASWVADLSNERMTSIADNYLGGDGLEAAFRERFGIGLPETLNGDHRILIVGSRIDASSERIIKYLSEAHGVHINAATFQYFREADGAELLARVFLIEPSEADLHTRTKGSSKRRPYLSYEELDALAVDNGVGDLYAYAVSALGQQLQTYTTRSSIGFAAQLDQGQRSVISLLPGESSSEEGLRFQLYKSRYREVTTLSLEEVERVMPANHEDRVAYSGSDYEAFQGFIVDRNEIDEIVNALRPGLSRAGASIETIA